MKAEKELTELSKQSELLITEDVLERGISKADFYNFVREHGYEKVAQGIYAPSGSLVDESYLVHLRCTKAVFSHDEALLYHGLSNREPLRPTITIYTGYNTKRLVESGVKVYTVKKDLLEIGKTEVTDSFGNKIPMYDLERTICDVVRSRNSIEIQDFQEALKAYVSRKDKDLNKLMKYADYFRVGNIIKKYMEVLL